VTGQIDIDWIAAGLDDLRLVGVKIFRGVPAGKQLGVEFFPVGFRHLRGFERVGQRELLDRGEFRGAIDLYLS